MDKLHPVAKGTDQEQISTRIGARLPDPANQDKTVHAGRTLSARLMYSLAFPLVRFLFSETAHSQPDRIGLPR